MIHVFGSRVRSFRFESGPLAGSKISRDLRRKVCFLPLAFVSSKPAAFHGRGELYNEHPMFIVSKVGLNCMGKFCETVLHMGHFRPSVLLTPEYCARRPRVDPVTDRSYTKTIILRLEDTLARPKRPVFCDMPSVLLKRDVFCKYDLILIFLQPMLSPLRLERKNMSRKSDICSYNF